MGHSGVSAVFSEESNTCLDSGKLIAKRYVLLQMWMEKIKCCAIGTMCGTHIGDVDTSEGKMGKFRLADCQMCP